MGYEHAFMYIEWTSTSILPKGHQGILCFGCVAPWKKEKIHMCCQKKTIEFLFLVTCFILLPTLTHAASVVISFEGKVDWIISGGSGSDALLSAGISTTPISISGKIYYESSQAILSSSGTSYSMYDFPTGSTQFNRAELTVGANTWRSGIRTDVYNDLSDSSSIMDEWVFWSSGDPIQWPAKVSESSNYSFLFFWKEAYYGPNDPPALTIPTFLNSTELPVGTPNFAATNALNKGGEGAIYSSKGGAPDRWLRAAF